MHDLFGIVGTTQAGTFLVEAAVAEGGFAVVYRAHHVAFRSRVALKCLKIPRTISAADRDAFLEKFRQEAELLFRLSRVVPAVVQPLQIGTLDIADRFVPFLAMEWLEGEALDVLRDRRLDEGLPPFGLRTLLTMLSPVANGLASAHAFSGPDGPQTIVHCDVKPENLFVTEVAGAQTMKLLDFGIARVRSSAGANKETPAGGSTVFTPYYAAPEQWWPDKLGRTGPWTDVYSLALSMVDVLSARQPVEGALVEVARRALDPMDRPTPWALGVDVSAEVEATFARALRVSPAARTQSIDAFWRELGDAVEADDWFAPRSRSGIAPKPEIIESRPSRSPASGSHRRQTLDANPMRSRGTWRVGRGSESGVVEQTDGVAIADEQTKPRSAKS